MNITVKYSCYQCGLRDAELSVPAREDEDVVVWMERMVGQNIKTDHARRSPHCRATSVQNLMIPITGAQKIGGPTAQ